MKQKLIDYYNIWCQINKAYMDLRNKLFILDILSPDRDFISRDTLLYKLNRLYNAGTKYGVLTPHSYNIIKHTITEIINENVYSIEIKTDSFRDYVNIVYDLEPKFDI